jgi:CheY-like chemotaxis protein
MKILVVDQSPLVRELFKSQAWDSQITTVASVAEARKANQGTAFDLLIVGTPMETETLPFLQAFSKQAKVIVIAPAGLPTFQGLAPVVANLADLEKQIHVLFPTFTGFSPDFEPVSFSGAKAQALIKLIREHNHDLNNKMSVISTATSLALKTPELASEMISLIEGSTAPNVVTDRAKQMLAEISNLFPKRKP